MSLDPVIVRTPQSWFWLLASGGAVVGAAAGLVIRPVFEWMLTHFESAPGALRIAAEVPVVWAVAILAAVGAVMGGGLVLHLRDDGATLTVDDDGVQVKSGPRRGYQPRERASAAALDGDDLVLLDERSTEWLRTDVGNLPKSAVERAFRTHGYHWLGTTPLEFQPWIDGHPELSDDVHRLLRDRGRALADDKPGTVADLTDRLRDSGIAVRDRRGAQGYRRVPLS